MFEAEVKIHDVDGKMILEVLDEIDGETYYFEVVSQLNPACYCTDEFLKASIARMMAVGAKVTGIDNLDEIDVSEHGEDAIDLFWELYQEAEASLPENYVTAWSDFGDWFLLRRLDKLSLND